MNKSGNVQREKQRRNSRQIFRLGMDVCVVCGRGIIDMKKEDIKVHN
jgi:hypothetical protein